MVPGQGIHLLKRCEGETSSFGQADVGNIKFLLTHAKNRALHYFDDYSRDHLGYGKVVTACLVDLESSPTPTLVAKPIAKYVFEVLYYTCSVDDRLDGEAVSKGEAVHRCTTVPLNDKAVIKLFDYFFYRDERWKTKYKWEPPIGQPGRANLASSDQLIGDRKEGVIYLLKVGDWYKIGKTIDPSSRMRQLDIQLPEKAEKVHEIVTNDIDHAERHWHRYFAEKRGNGEWFKLSDADVAEFVTHKRMELR